MLCNPAKKKKLFQKKKFCMKRDQNYLIDGIDIGIHNDSYDVFLVCSLNFNFQTILYFCFMNKIKF